MTKASFFVQYLKTNEPKFFLEMQVELLADPFARHYLMDFIAQDEVLCDLFEECNEEELVALMTGEEYLAS